MPSIPIIMPQLGESIAEATIVSLLVKPGDLVVPDQDIIEVETSKATMNVTAPCPGKLQKFLVATGQSYAVGAVLGYVESTVEEAARVGLDAPAPRPNGEEEEGSKPPSGAPHKTVQPTVRGLPVPANAAGASYMSPRMKARMAELGLHAADLAGLPGSGAAGRVTIQDFEKFIEHLEQHRLSQASSMRVAVADAMRRSWTRPLATVALPACFDALLEHRKLCTPKPGPALYALRALAVALSENSAPAGRLIGNKIVHPSCIDIGFAVFGLTWATPIPLPEQTLVLGMGAARQMPRWDAAQRQFVPMMEANITLSFDHRVLDGGAAGRLLARVAQLLASPEKL